MSSLPSFLRYSSDDEPGISRIGAAGDYTYIHPNGQAVKQKSTLKRISTLGIPPAYREVWICKDEFGHIQATGLDDAGRKQYRYHEKWREFRDRKKFDDLCEFGNFLPTLRRRVARDLRRDMTDERFCCAAVVRLIDRGALRVGGGSKTAQGATTLRNSNIKIDGDAVKLKFKAKGGKRVQKTLRDKNLHRAMDKFNDLPGRALFQYVNSRGDIHRIRSEQINDYIGDGFTAKTFRTWHGSLAAFKVALSSDESITIKAMCEAAAQRLHNTPAICRNSYIHPDVIALSEDTQVLEDLTVKPQRGLKKAERRLLALMCKA